MTITKQRDKDFPKHQQLPRQASIDFLRVKDDKIIMQINGVNLGDPVDDNSESIDFYRFHDVFHWSYVTFLGWSPVIRAILKVKRKDNPKIDRVQDGARAIISEEAISLQIFHYAKKNNCLEDVVRIDCNLLKYIKDLTEGLEIKDVDHKTWEHAIKEGYRVFREIKKANTKTQPHQLIGTLEIDADKPSMKFIPANLK